MSSFSHFLVELTGARDRAVLKRRLIDTLVTHYSPRTVRLLQLEDQRWKLRWSQGLRVPVPSDAVTVAARQEALVRRQALHIAQSPWLSLFPVGSSEVLELEYSAAISSESHHQAEQFLRVQQNVLGLLDWGERDTLTGLFNRKTFDEVFNRLNKPRARGVQLRAQESGRRQWGSGEPCWLAVIDIDNFKQVNDDHGHLVGDQVLAMVAALMNDAFRQQDWLYRFGGEEFVVLTTCAEARGMFIALERIRQRIDAHCFPSVGHLTISAGFTRIRAHDTPMSAFVRADRAVYAAKKAGRNRAVFFDGSELVEPSKSGAPLPLEAPLLESESGRQFSLNPGLLSWLVCILFVTTILPGCMSRTDDQSLSSLVRLSADTASAHCAAGGTRISAGLDANGNGMLEDDEVTSTQFVCDGTLGATGATGAAGHNTLLTATSEPSGANCSAGGLLSRSGNDLNDDGLLQNEEITQTAYLCNGSTGAMGVAGPAGRRSLLRTTLLGAGSSCSNSGLRVDAGLDADGSGILEDAEVSSTAYVCDGTSGRTSLIAQENEPAGSQCVAGGIKITSGLDLNGDLILQSAEVLATSYVCSPPARVGLAWLQVTASAQQAEPNTGYIIESNSLVTVQLPASAALTVGDLVAVTGAGRGGWRIAQQPDQQMRLTNVPSAAPGQSWTTPTPPTSYWKSAASSADGQRLVLGGDLGRLYVSADGGASWTARESVRRWYGLASSSDGMRLLAADWTGQLHTSADGGSTWTAREQARSWSAVASSEDGLLLLAADTGGYLYTSYDGGQNWAPRATAMQWRGVASSANGRIMFAAANGDALQVSTDYGQTWTARETSRAWSAIVCSADGMDVFAAAYDGQIYRSRDAGQTWVPTADVGLWVSLAASADGRRLIAGTLYSGLYTSNDSGTRWSLRLGDIPTGIWAALAASADGSQFIAGDLNGTLRLSTVATTPGTSGSVSGGQFDSLTLQYLGGGQFTVYSHAGAPTYQ